MKLRLYSNWPILLDMCGCVAAVVDHFLIMWSPAGRIVYPTNTGQLELERLYHDEAYCAQCVDHQLEVLRPTQANLNLIVCTTTKHTVPSV